MIVARIVGTVVATRKHDLLQAFKLMLVRPVHPDGSEAEEEFLAADSVGAGTGEKVLVVIEGRSACQATRRSHAPLDAAIVGIVDRLDFEGATPRSRIP